MPTPGPQRVAERDPFALPRSARLVLWGGAFLAGATSLDEAGERTVERDVRHRVSGLPGEGAEVSVPVALGRLRSLGVRGLRLALPAPGDPAGLPGPPAFNAAAIEAGEAVLTVGALALGLVPRLEAAGSSGVLVRWLASPVDAGGCAPGLAEAERELRQVVREATAALAALDLAGADPESRAALRKLDGGGAAAYLPQGHPQRAVRVLELARRLTATVAIARRIEGAAVTAGEARARATALDPLDRAARRALAAAASARLESDVGPGPAGASGPGQSRER